jgi:hypothetical protein
MRSAAQLNGCAAPCSRRKAAMRASWPARRAAALLCPAARLRKKSVKIAAASASGNCHCALSTDRAPASWNACRRSQETSNASASLLVGPAPPKTVVTNWSSRGVPKPGSQVPSTTSSVPRRSQPAISIPFVVPSPGVCSRPRLLGARLIDVRESGLASVRSSSDQGASPCGSVSAWVSGPPP